MRFPLTLIVAAALALATVEAKPAGADDGTSLVLGLGVFDVLRDDEATEGRVEARFAEFGWGVGPLIGALFTSDAAVYAYGGFYLDLFFGNWALTPSLAAGAYGRGHGQDLGSVVEFRSQIDLAYRFANRARLGLAFSHISNAGIGDQNPGAESLLFTYAVPLGRR